MKTEMLKVGAKGEREPVRVPVQIAETLEDMTELARGDVKTIVRLFNRGFRIESQEKSGARAAFKEGKDEQTIASIVADFDPTSVKERRGGAGVPRTKKVTLPGNATQLPADQLLELLRAQGINVQIAAEA